jgi:hypothetical protein
MRVRTNTKMTLDYINDFYVLEALKVNIGMEISSDPKVEFKHSLTRLLFDIERYASDFIPNIAYRIFVYLYAACLGEARHAANTMAESYFLKEMSCEQRNQAFTSALEFAPNDQNIQAIVDIFSQGWRGSFGGRKWLKIAKALQMYRHAPDAAFIDHVVDLQHNTGTIFNKSESDDILNFRVRYSGDFLGFLDCKFRYNILKRPCGDMYVTRKVAGFVRRYELIFGLKPAKWIKSHLEILGPYEIFWGNGVLTTEKKWHDWAQCKEGVNEPDLRWVIYKAGMSEVSVYNYTKSEFQEKLNEIKTEAVAILGRLASKYERKLDKAVYSQYNRYNDKCKVDKLPITYTVIPVKIKNVDYYNLEIQVPFEYYGYGEKTEYGFKIVDASQGITQKNEHELGFDGQRGYTDALASLSNYGKIKINTRTNNWTWGDKKLEALFT